MGVRRRPGGKGNAEANHSQLWHKAQVSFLAPGKQQRRELLGKAVGFFPAPAYKAVGPVSRYQLTMSGSHFGLRWCGCFDCESCRKAFISSTRLASDVKTFFFF